MDGQTDGANVKYLFVTFLLQEATRAALGGDECKRRAGRALTVGADGCKETVCRVDAPAGVSL